MTGTQTMSDYPALENFLAAYFHQDWAMEHATPDAVVAYYRDSESTEQVAATREELARLLAQGLDDEALGTTLRKLGSEYDPTRDGVSRRDWLTGMQASLAAH